MNGHIAVAIDGPSGAGKSSLARRAAAKLGYIYVDTGAIYRTVGLAADRAGLDTHNEDAVKALLPSLDIHMGYNAADEQCMTLNGEDVSSAIRQPKISMVASNVSAMPPVRAFLLDMQRKMALENDVIMDGRDIGTVVLPDAEVKIYLTASPDARAQRRMLELEQKGMTQPYDDVLREILQRDEQDMTRAIAPLRQAEDAILLDTSDIGFDESLERLCAIIAAQLEKKA